MLLRQVRVHTVVASVLVGAVATAAMAAGSIKATAEFNGDKKKVRRVVVKMDADAYCKNSHEKKVGSEDYLIRGGKIKNVVFYVKDGLGEETFEAPSDHLVLDQVGCMYRPHVMTVHAGQPVTIRNSDDPLHNIHSFSEKQRPFNFAQPKKGMEKQVKFAREEFVKVKCDVHPWMSAYVAVFTHPFHAVSDKEGVGVVENLEPGEYTLAGWHEELGEVESNVTVKDGEAAEVTLTFTTE